MAVFVHLYLRASTVHPFAGAEHLQRTAQRLIVPSVLDSIRNEQVRAPSIGGLLKTETTRIRSHEVEYLYLSGKPSTIVLVNGSGGPLVSWRPIVEEISRDHSVLAYNRAGIGKSSPPDSPQTACEMANELHELMEFLKIDGAIILVGHSIGGLVVLQFCLSFPGIAKGVILLEPSTVWDIENSKRLPKDSKNPNGELNFVKASANCLRDLSGFPKVPTIVGVGVKSGLFYWMFRSAFEARRRNLRRLGEELGNAKVVEFTKSGHFPQISEPKKTSDLVIQLCQDLASTSA